MSSDDGSLLLALQRATHATLDAIIAELAGDPIGPAEANVLATLADGAPRTPSELAAQVGSRTTTMTSVLDRLERRMLVKRGRQPSDRRAIRIELTAAGRKAAARTREAFDRVEQRAVAELPASTVAALRTALDRMAEVEVAD